MDHQFDKAKFDSLKIGAGESGRLILEMIVDRLTATGDNAYFSTTYRSAIKDAVRLIKDGQTPESRYVTVNMPSL